MMCFYGFFTVVRNDTDWIPEPRCFKRLQIILDCNKANILLEVDAIDISLSIDRELKRNGYVPTYDHNAKNSGGLSRTEWRGQMTYFLSSRPMWRR